MPKIDLSAAPARKGSGYPPPFDAPCATRTRRRLGDAGGLSAFGVNLMSLRAGDCARFLAEIHEYKGK